MKDRNVIWALIVGVILCTASIHLMGGGHPVIGVIIFAVSLWLCMPDMHPWNWESHKRSFRDSKVDKKVDKTA